MSGDFLGKLEEVLLGPKKEREASLCPHGKKYLDEPIECQECQGIKPPSRELSGEEREQAEQKIGEIKSILKVDNLRQIINTDSEESEHQLKTLKDSIAWLEESGLADVSLLKIGLERLETESLSGDDMDERYNYVISLGNELEPYETILSKDPTDLEEYDQKVVAWKQRIQKAKAEGKTFYE